MQFAHVRFKRPAISKHSASHRGEMLRPHPAGGQPAKVALTTPLGKRIVSAGLIELAKQMGEGQKRGKDLGLTDDEVGFYDALEVNESAVKVLGEPTLKNIAQELVAHVRKSVTIDWTLRESAQAQIRVLVRRILRKYGYPPDKQKKATQTVLEQAKLLCAEWAG